MTCKINHSDVACVPEFLCGVCSPSKHRMGRKQRRAESDGLTLAPSPEMRKIREAIMADFNDGDNDNMTSKIGPRERQLREQRESKAKGNGKTKANRPAASAKTKTKAAKPSRTKAAKPPKAKATAKPKSGPLETIRQMLARQNGCTTKEVLKAIGWPTVSMPAQAQRLGVKLVKSKGDDGATRYRSA